MISYGFLCFTAWLLYANYSVAALFNVMVASRSCGNICFDQNYRPGKITLQDSVFIIKYLVAASLDNITCAVFLALIAV